MNKRLILILSVTLNLFITNAQVKSLNGGILASTPPMGWMSWNYFGDNLNEKDIREIADAMVQSGLLAAGYQYIFIDDGWQGGRDNRNNIVPDAIKFPSGIKALADYVHARGLKLGIYSDAAPLTCAGYTASLNFERQDAKTFAAWGIDYLKYDYCGAPSDSTTAKIRYKRMSDALRNCGRDISFGICEWGERQPWKWAAVAGGQVWRTTGDVRDKWKNLNTTSDPNAAGFGILDIIDSNAPLNNYAGTGHWNDMDMLVVGLYGKKGPSSDLGGVGCNDIEYQSQMSLWCMMNSPLAASNDIRNMNAVTKNILTNKEVIALNQDALAKQCERKINDDTWNIFIKQLVNGDYALAILNRSEKAQRYTLKFSELGLLGKYEIRDLWNHKELGKMLQWNGLILSHETKLFRIKPTNKF
jgi:alpha-galactosidase